MRTVAVRTVSIRNDDRVSFGGTSGRAGFVHRFS